MSLTKEDVATAYGYCPVAFGYWVKKGFFHRSSTKNNEWSISDFLQIGLLKVLTENGYTTYKARKVLPKVYSTLIQYIKESDHNAPWNAFFHPQSQLTIFAGGASWVKDPSMTVIHFTLRDLVPRKLWNHTGGLEEYFKVVDSEYERLNGGNK